MEGESYWPEGAPREYTLAAYVAAYAQLGYEACDSSGREAGFEKVAIFVNDEGVPAHAARQLVTGRWTSKLGDWEDIDHQLEDVEGDSYGSVAVVLRRPRPPSKNGVSET